MGAKQQIIDKNTGKFQYFMENFYFFGNIWWRQIKKSRSMALRHERD